MKSLLNLTNSAMRLSISLLTSACRFCVKRRLSSVTNAMKAGNGSAGGYLNKFDKRMPRTKKQDIPYRRDWTQIQRLAVQEIPPLMMGVTELEPLLMYHLAHSQIPWVNHPWLIPHSLMQHRFYEHQEEHMHSDLEQQPHICTYRMGKSSIITFEKHALVFLINTTVIDIEPSFFCNVGVAGGSL